MFWNLSASGCQSMCLQITMFSSKASMKQHPWIPIFRCSSHACLAAEPQSSIKRMP